MILKSLSRRSGTRQLLEYLFAKKEKGISNNKKPIIIKHNIRSHTLDKWVQEFEANEKMRIHPRKNAVRIFHTVLSFSNKDKQHITEPLLRAIAKQYIALRGRDSLYVGVVHHDRDHLHLHLVMSGTKYYTGEANRISRAEFHALKLAMDAYQKQHYPMLTHSLPAHGSSKALHRQPGASRNGRTSQKDTLLQVLNTAYKTAGSVNAFLNELKKEGHEPYYRAGKLTGVTYKGGRKFRFTTLGYSPEKISKLDTLKNTESKELAELQRIRRSSKERGTNRER